MATPTVAASSRCGSRVAASDIKTKVTCPGSSSFMPWVRDRMRHLGGKMLDTRTRLHAAIPADRSASSNEVSFSRCLPTPLVKNISLGTNPTTSRSFRVRGRESFSETSPDEKDSRPLFMRWKLHGKQQGCQCQGNL